MQTERLNSLGMAWPTHWDALFGIARPLIVEIGFGNGDYLIALAEAHPDHNIIGFEISNRSLEKAESKARNRGLDNVRVIMSHGETALHHLFTPQSIRQLHVNYPDPWFKSRHSGRRLIQRDTLDAMVSRLEIGGLFYLATDIIEYAEMSHELLAETAGLDNLLDSAWVATLPDRLITTKYEQKGIREGRPGNYFKYRRNDHPAPDVPVRKDLPVPHVVIKTPTPVLDIVNATEKHVYNPAPDVHVALLTASYTPMYDAALFEVVINESTLEQHVALSLRHKADEDNTYNLTYASFGQPRPTDGMHHAVRVIGEWIISLHDEAEITHSSLRQL